MMTPIMIAALFTADKADGSRSRVQKRSCIAAPCMGGHNGDPSLWAPLTSRQTYLNVNPLKRIS
jgi:hypothetical protein